MKLEDLQKLVDSQYPALPKLRAVARPVEEVKAVAEPLKNYVRNLLAQMLAGGDKVSLEAVEALQHGVNAMRERYGDEVRKVLAYHLLAGSTYSPDELEQCVHIDFPAPDHLLGKGGLVERLINERRELFSQTLFDTLQEIETTTPSSSPEQPEAV